MDKKVAIIEVSDATAVRCRLAEIKLSCCRVGRKIHARDIASAIILGIDDETIRQLLNLEVAA